MRILFLALGDRKVASSRIRAWNFAEHLSRRGQEARVIRGASVGAIKEVLFGRWDVIVVQKWVPPLWMILLIRLKAKIVVYDCDDAIYMVDEAKDRVTSAPDANKHRRRAQRVSQRMPRLLRRCDSFTSATRVISSDLNCVASKPGLVFPGPMPARAVDSSSDYRSGMVWLGSPATERYLQPLAPVLSTLHGRLQFTAMGASEASANFGIRTAAWSEEAELDFLRASLFGLFIQPPGDWEERKSGYKILEYVASGVVPVVQKNPQVVDLLPENYPFYFDNGVSSSQFLEVLDQASAMSNTEMDALSKQLKEYTDSRFSYESTVERWLRFIEDLKQTKSGRPL